MKNILILLLTSVLIFCFNSCQNNKEVVEPSSSTQIEKVRYETQSYINSNGALVIISLRIETLVSDKKKNYAAHCAARSEKVWYTTRVGSTVVDAGCYMQHYNYEGQKTRTSSCY